MVKYVFETITLAEGKGKECTALRPQPISRLCPYAGVFPDLVSFEGTCLEGEGEILNNGFYGEEFRNQVLSGKEPMREERKSCPV